MQSGYAIGCYRACGKVRCDTRIAINDARENPTLPDELLIACLYDGYLSVDVVYGDSCRHPWHDSSSEMAWVARNSHSPTPI